MKFVCDRCQTRYNIADEKIQQRIVRIRCKNCGGVITLHAGAVIAGPQDNSARHSSDLPAAPAEVRVSSRVSRPPVPRSEWFVAVDGVEKGPLTCAEAAKYIVTFGPDHVVHVWKEGMDEWKRPKDVAIIAQELSTLKRSPSRAPAESAAASADATVVTPTPVAFDASPRPASPRASGSGPKAPGLGSKSGSAPKGAPLPSLGSSTKAVPGATGSAPKHVPPAVSGSGPKAAPLPTMGSGPKAPPPIPPGHKAPPPIPGSGPRVTPVAAAHVVPEGRLTAKSSTYPVAKTPPPVTGRTTPPAAAHGLPDAKLFSQPSAPHAVKAPSVTAPRSTPAAAAHVVPEVRPAAKSSTHPVVKTPAPVTAPQAAPAAAAQAVPEVRPAAKSSTHPVVKTPAPVTVHQPEAEKPGHETASASGASDHTPAAESGFDDDVPTSPRARQSAREDKDDPTSESTPAVDSTPGAQDFFQSKTTPPPSPALPVSSVHPIRESKNWPVANLSFAHPPVMPEGMSVEGAMALPTPAPMSGPLFANVADLPVKTLVGHAEVGLSRLTGLAALVHKHRHLKYVAAAGVLVVLIIAVILLSWQGENGKGVSKVAEIEKKARAAALAADPVPVPLEEPAPAATSLNVEPEPGKSRASAAAHASKRVSRPAVPTPAPAPAQNGKAAPVEDPFSPPAGMTRSAEKPIPLAALQGKRASAANEPRPVSQAQISEVVRKKENQAGLKTCYERALKRDGRLRTGRLDITVSIGAMGTVQRVQVNGSADFMVIDKCLKEAIRHWRFPASSEEYATSFPLILQGG